jgi:hypothetical protein
MEEYEEEEEKKNNKEIFITLERWIFHFFSVEDDDDGRSAMELDTQKVETKRENIQLRLCFVSKIVLDWDLKYSWR